MFHFPGATARATKVSPSRRSGTNPAARLVSATLACVTGSPVASNNRTVTATPLSITRSTVVMKGASGAKAGRWSWCVAASQVDAGSTVRR